MYLLYKLSTAFGINVSNIPCSATYTLELNLTNYALQIDFPSAHNMGDTIFTGKIINP